MKPNFEKYFYFTLICTNRDPPTIAQRSRRNIIHTSPGSIYDMRNRYFKVKGTIIKFFPFKIALSKCTSSARPTLLYFALFPM
jgi:hypothetical protein